MLLQRQILFLVLLLFFLTSVTYGDGCFVWNKGADLYEPSQKTIIYWDGKKEVLILQVKYEGQAEDFAWIVPLPAQPEVTAIEPEKNPFAEISLYTQMRYYRGKAPTDTGPKNLVQVLERKIVGVYDIAVLSASKPGALNKWLNKNGYNFPAEREDLLEHYTKKNWIYAALRIDPNALESREIEKLKTGELQPIRFVFKSEEMVYPLKISSLNAGETDLLLYLLANEPMIVKDENKHPDLSIEQNLMPYISPWTISNMDPQYGTYRKTEMKELPLTGEALNIASDTKLSLCKYNEVYTSEDMTDDLTFETFKPLTYWKKRLSRKPVNENYKKEQDRRCAFTVLAWYDTKLLNQFATSEFSENRELVAMHPKATEKLLLKLSKDDDSRVKYNLVENKNLPLRALRDLAKDKNERLRARVARHPNTSLDMLEKFLHDESRDVRSSALLNEKITEEMLEFLSNDVDEIIRCSVAHNEKTPLELLRKLSKDESPYVRACVAQQQRLPEELIEYLAGNDSTEVRRAIAIFQKLSTETLTKFSNDPNSLVRSGVAYNPRTPPEMLTKLANDTDVTVRRSVAENPNTPEDILRYLADDDDYLVRHCIADNKSTPIKILMRLTEDENPEVSQQAKKSLTDRNNH